MPSANKSMFSSPAVLRAGSIACITNACIVAVCNLYVEIVRCPET